MIRRVARSGYARVTDERADAPETGSAVAYAAGLRPAKEELIQLSFGDAMMATSSFGRANFLLVDPQLYG